MRDMKKFSFIFLSVVTLCGIISLRPLLADRDDEANRWYLDAYNLYKLGKLDQSLEMLKKVTEINPDHAEAHFGMGSIYFRQNMFDDAVKEFTKVTKIKPEYVEAYQRLWLAYKKLGMNDKAEEELQKYKKLIEERMQNMAGGPSQVVKPVTPPKKEEPEERAEPEKTESPETRAEASHAAETKPPDTSARDTRVPESGVQEKVVEKERPAVEKQDASSEESRPLASEKPSLPETKPLGGLEATKRFQKQYAEPPKPSYEKKNEPESEPEYKSPYIKVDKKNPVFKNLFKSFRQAGSTLFKNPLKKSAERWKGTYFGKLMKSILYYVVGVQIWLCIVTILGMYFWKSKKQGAS